MDIDKPVVRCIECGAVVSVGWQLYCDKCYRKFIRESADIVRKSAGVRRHGVDSGSADVVRSENDVVYDKNGQRYVFNGHAWVKRSS